MRYLAVLLAIMIIASGCAASTHEVQGNAVSNVESVASDAENKTSNVDNSVSIVDNSVSNVENTAVSESEEGKENEQDNSEETEQAALEIEPDLMDGAVAEDGKWREAYLQVMEENQPNIRRYEETLWEWAQSWKDDESLSDLNPSPAQMCLEDLDRDGVPELLFVADTNDESAVDPSAKHDLYIYTYKDNEAKLIFQDLAALEAGGGWFYYVAIEADRLVLVRTAVDLWADTEILWYLYDGQTMECVKQRYLFDENDPDISPRYMCGEASDAMQAVDEDEYVRVSHMLTQGFEKLLMRNMDLGIPAYDYERYGAISALTYSELRRYLQGDAGSATGSATGSPAEESDAISLYFTNEQLENIRQALSIPDDLSVEIEISEPYYWEGGDMELAQIDFYHDGEYVAGAAFQTYSENMVRNIYIYSE